DILAARQARQVVVLLFVRAVVQQQFGGPQGIGHHDGDRQCGAAGGQLGDYGGMRQRRKTQAAVFLGNDHAEEAVGLDVVPGFGGDVLVAAGDLPVVHQGADSLDFVVQDRKSVA